MKTEDQKAQEGANQIFWALAIFVGAGLAGGILFLLSKLWEAVWA